MYASEAEKIEYVQNLVQAAVAPRTGKRAISIVVCGPAVPTRRGVLALVVPRCSPANPTRNGARPSLYPGVVLPFRPAEAPGPRCTQV